MTRESLLITFGIILALAPFLGLPYPWLMGIIPVFALAVVLIGVTLRKKRFDEASRVEPLAPYESPEV